MSDDGVGGADPAAGSGLRGLVDRVAVLDGTLERRQPARRRARPSAAEIPLAERDAGNTLAAVNALPTGTVTFLFADVEGSTALQQRGAG